MNRRLPVYLLIDCSESMIGQGIEAVRTGLNSMLGALRRDPHALESVYLSVITYDSKARLECPLTTLLDFQEPRLTLRPGTSLGAALELLADRIQSEVRKTSHDTKGDYRPLVLLLTDGQPSDNWRGPLSRIGASVRPRPANIYAIGCGEDVDYSVLQSVTDVVLRMDDMAPESFGKLFVWLTASVSSASQGIGEAADGSINLQKLPDNIEKVETPAESLEDGPPRQLFIHALCGVKRLPYLMRYGLDPAYNIYSPTAAHRLDGDNADFGERGTGLPPVNSRMVDGCPDCPHCGSPGAGSCGNCGVVFCGGGRDESGTSTCPGCNAKLTPNKDSGGGFQIRASQG